MNMNYFYEVDGCIDFIPVTIVGISDDGVIVATTNDKRDCQLVVKEVYRLWVRLLGCQSIYEK